MKSVPLKLYVLLCQDNGTVTVPDPKLAMQASVMLSFNFSGGRWEQTTQYFVKSVRKPPKNHVFLNICFLKQRFLKPFLLLYTFPV